MLKHISATGTNLQALMDAAGTERLPNAEITYVISSRSNVKGLERAANHDPPIPSSVCALKTFLNKNPGTSRVDYDKEVARRVVESRPDLVVLAGWMHILSPEFLSILDGTSPPPPVPEYLAASQPTNSSSETTQQIHLPIPIINLHPALPGAFDGANAIGRAYEAAQRGEIQNTGVMVHKVVPEVDAGEPLVVREVPCVKGETLEDLEAKMHNVSIRSVAIPHRTPILIDLVC
jgi:phosphoribosylglycinamide formyltransferase